MNNTKTPYKSVSVHSDRPSGDQTYTVCTVYNHEMQYTTINTVLDRHTHDQT